MKKLIIILTIMLLCGCADYKELNDLGIVTSIGINKKDDSFNICLEVLNTDKKNSKNNIYYSSGKTLNEAINKVNNKSYKKIYGGHLNQIIVSEEATNDFDHIIDTFIRLTEVKDEIDMFISEDDPCKIIKNNIKNNNEESYKLLNNARNYSSRSSNTNIDTYLSNYMKYGIDPVISSVKIDKNKVIIDGIAITKDGKFYKYLDEKETIGYNFIRNGIEELSLPIKYDNNHMAIKILESKTNNKVSKNNNKYIINVNINIDAYITEYDIDLDLNKNESIKKLENKSKKEIKNYVNKVIKLDKESDFLGFKRMIYENYKDRTNDYKIKTNINVNIKRKGELKTKIKEK